MTIALIYRDRIAPGHSSAYRVIEEEAARACAELQCPHPHFGMESLSGNEAWWLNFLDSESHLQGVVAKYASNLPLTAALEDIAKRKEGMAAGHQEVATELASEGNGRGWSPIGARFVVVAMTGVAVDAPMSVFAWPDKSQFVLIAARTNDEANALAARIGGATVFAIRPTWGMPAAEWVAADPEFWKVNPSTR